MSQTEQLTTFYVNNELFGIQVHKVQEVTNKPIVFKVPLSPPFVKGLINLRGQIATALGLRVIFANQDIESESEMSVVCKIDGNLISLIVDKIGDVVEVDKEQFELPPDTLQANIRNYIKGIYKLNGQLLSILDLDMLAKELSPNNDSSNGRNIQ